MDYGIIQDFLLAAYEGAPLAESTIAAYSAIVYQFMGWASENGAMTPTEVMRTDIRGYVARIMDGSLKPATVASRIVALRSFFSSLYNRGIIGIDPTADFRPRPVKAVPRFITPQQASDYLDSIDTRKPTGARNRAMAEMIYGSALRTKELVGLNVGDIDLTHAEVGPRRQMMSDPSVEWARRYLRGERRRMAALYPQPGADAAFLSSTSGRRLSARGAYEALRSDDTFGGTPVTPRILRLSCGYALARGGMSLIALREFMGYKSIPGSLTAMFSAGRNLETLRRCHPRGKS